MEMDTALLNLRIHVLTQKRQAQQYNLEFFVTGANNTSLFHTNHYIGK